MTGGAKVLATLTDIAFAARFRFSDLKTRLVDFAARSRHSRYANQRCYYANITMQRTMHANEQFNNAVQYAPARLALCVPYRDAATSRSIDRPIDR
ncbi:unnamed protein product, partial [Iphiclides podalirius]